MKEINQGGIHSGAMDDNQMVDAEQGIRSVDVSSSEVHEVKQVDSGLNRTITWLLGSCKREQSDNLVQKPNTTKNQESNKWSKMLKGSCFCSRKRLKSVWKKKPKKTPSQRQYQSTEPQFRYNQTFDSRFTANRRSIGSRADYPGYSRQGSSQININIFNNQTYPHQGQQEQLEVQAFREAHRRSLLIDNKRQREAYLQKKKEQLLRMYTMESQRSQFSMPRSSILSEPRRPYKKASTQVQQHIKTQKSNDEVPILSTQNPEVEAKLLPVVSKDQPQKGLNFSKIGKQSIVKKDQDIPKNNDQIAETQNESSLFAQTIKENQQPINLDKPQNTFQKNTQNSINDKSNKEDKDLKSKFKEELDAQIKRQNDELIKNMKEINERIQQPDEDTLQEFNLALLNLAVLRNGIIPKHGALKQSIEQLNDVKILKLLASKIRNVFAFLDNNLVVVATEDVIGLSESINDIEDAWESFVATYQDKIQSNQTDSVIILNAPSSPSKQSNSRIKRMEMIILNKTKIARLVWTDEESEPQWSDDGVDGTGPIESRNKILDQKLLIIHRIMNGEKQKVTKTVQFFFFGVPPKQQQDEKEKEEVKVLEIEAPSWCKDTMITQQPLNAMFVFYRFYLLQSKYRLIVKYDLNHVNYFKKRDRILEIISQEEYRSYFVATNLMFLAL